MVRVNVAVDHSTAIRTDVDAAVDARISDHERDISVLVLRVRNWCPGVSTVIGAEDAGWVTRSTPGEPAQQIERWIGVAGSGHPEAD